MAIRKENMHMANYHIAKSLHLNPGQTFKRLKILSKNKVLKAIEGNPAFYEFNSNNTAQDFIIQTVECPGCQKLHIIHHDQTTIQCSCLTASGRQRRFYIFDKRIIDKRVLTKQVETPAREIEKDVSDLMA